MEELCTLDEEEDEELTDDLIEVDLSNDNIQNLRL